MAGNDELPFYWVPEAPGLNSLRISNKDTPLEVRLKGFALAFAHQDIS